jgi:hypothetical protein
MGALPVVSRLKVGSATGLAQRCGVEGGGVDGAVSREVAAQRARNMGNLMAQTKISPRLGFRVSGVTPLIPNTLLVSADIVQPIPIIFSISWLTSADTNMLSLYIIPTHHYSDRAPQWRWLLFQPRATVPTKITFFEVFFSTFSNMFLPFFTMVYIDLDFDFTMISLMDLGLFPSIYSKRYRIILMYIF